MNALAKHILLIITTFGISQTLSAQNLTHEEEMLLAPPEETVNAEETTPAEMASAGLEIHIDSTLFGMNIFSAIPDGVVVIQDTSVRNALSRKVAADDSHLMSGFRIRIFSDSRRSAREESLEVLRRFNEAYPYISVYRDYAAPNFKVSVGNFRNRVEAEQLLAIIKYEYPEAFVVRDRFKYPTIGPADISSLPDSLGVSPSDNLMLHMQDSLGTGQPPVFQTRRRDSVDLRLFPGNFYNQNND